MEILLLLVGLAVIGFTLLDATVTTLSTTTRAGPMTRVTTMGIWRAALALHRRRPIHGPLTAVGPGLLVLGLLQWLTGLWLGWTVVLGSQPGAVAITGTEPASWMDRLYFAGVSLFSLGTGDVVATGPGWRITSVLATATGLFVLTLSLSYFLSVVAAATDRRVLAVRLAMLGSSPQQIVLDAARSGRVTPELVDLLTSLGHPVVRLAEQHVTYHVLHYFHARRPDHAVVVGLARLDEALTILECAFPPDQRANELIVRALRAHLSRVVDVVGEVHRTVPVHAPPAVPAVSDLRAAGLPVVTDDEFRHRVEPLAGRRRELAALVASDGWKWDDV